VTEALSTETAAAPAGNAMRVQRRHAVNECISYAEAVRRVPSIAELCAAANLSARSLRRAFQSEFDLSPSEYFRIWALGEANRRLDSEEVEGETVTSVALGLGFTHLGRFSGSYRRLFGELPSATLRS
jgi:AraC-like DNA-binding protein